MKSIKYIMLWAVAVMILASCEQNDPIAELGDKTGYDVPSIYMNVPKPSVTAGEDMNLTVRYWSKTDDIAKVAIYARAENETVSEYTLVIDNVSFSTNYESAGEIVERSMIKEKVSDFNSDWQTTSNAYVSTFAYMVPSTYEAIDAKKKDVAYLHSVSAEVLNMYATSVVPALPRTFLNMIYVERMNIYTQEEFDGLYSEEGELLTGAADDLVSKTSAEVLIEMTQRADDYQFSYKSSTKMFFDAEVYTSADRMGETTERESSAE
ncbi:hypothetical protein V6R21_29305 [Limibacter armeniacum]|uniref:hypothetical protein n=1 Tax=Limibacter armeniacum TaxID=466084 RepID=UPI002FE5FDC9